MRALWVVWIGVCSVVCNLNIIEHLWFNKTRRRCVRHQLFIGIHVCYIVLWIAVKIVRAILFRLINKLTLINEDCKAVLQYEYEMKMSKYETSHLAPKLKNELYVCPYPPTFIPSTTKAQELNHMTAHKFGSTIWTLSLPKINHFHHSSTQNQQGSALRYPNPCH